MSLDSPSNGKHFLEGLIFRAETVLGKMIYKVRKTNITLEELVPMINSVFGFVNSWEESLKDIKLEMLGETDPAKAVAHSIVSEPSKPVKSNEDEIMEQMRQLDVKIPKSTFWTKYEDGEEADNEVEDSEEPKQRVVRSSSSAKGNQQAQQEMIPVFEFKEQSLKDYIDGYVGIGMVTYAQPGSTSFYIMDRANSKGKWDQMLVSLQNVTSRLEHFPAKVETVFGIELNGVIFRAVRSRSWLGENVPVKLVDTGEVVMCEEATARLFELPAFYRKFPALCIECCLVDVVDEPLCADFPGYLVESVYKDKKFEVCAQSGSVLLVNLSSYVAKKVPKVDKPVAKIVEPKKDYKISEGTLTQDQLDVLYEEPLSTSNAMKATMGFVPKDDRRICPFYDPKIEGCFKGAACRLEHVAKDPDGWTRDKAPHKIKIRMQLLEPPVGSKLSMIPTAIVNVEEFYAQLNQKENTSELTELQARLNDPNTVRCFRKMDHKPYTREYVFAMFHQDSSWYRAEVIEYYEDNLIQVFYLDYGNTEQVTLADLRLWDDQFDYLPFQAVHCRLANVSARNANDVDAIVALRDAILDKVVTVTVLDIRSYWAVLVNLEEDHVNGTAADRDVGRWLVRKKLAHARKPIVINGKDALIPA